MLYIYWKYICLCVYFITNIIHPYPFKEALSPTEPTAGTEKGKKKWRKKLLPSCVGWGHTAACGQGTRLSPDYLNLPNNYRSLALQTWDPGRSRHSSFDVNSVLILICVVEKFKILFEIHWWHIGAVPEPYNCSWSVKLITGWWRLSRF